MLNVLEAYLKNPAPVKCAVGAWIAKQGEEEQNLLEEIKNRRDVVMSDLYKDLNSESPLPFKVSLFRSHMRGYCACQ